jgi:hypothetical protein
MATINTHRAKNGTITYRVRIQPQGATCRFSDISYS